MSTVLLERVIGLFGQKFYQLSIPEKGLHRNHFPIFNDQSKKQVWFAGGGLVIVICLMFVICDLEFLIRQYSINPKVLDIFTGKAIET